MIRLALALLFLAAPAWGQTTYFMEHTAGPLAGCPNTDLILQTTLHSVEHNYVAASSEANSDNWNFNNLGVDWTYDGDWDCEIRVNVGTGGGAPNKFTIKVERVNSSCSVQSTIISEEITVAKGDSAVAYGCAAVNQSEVFASGDAVMVTLWQSNGSQTITVLYGLGPARDSEITVPAGTAPSGVRKRLMVIGMNEPREMKR